jgi:hypothetical protein
MDWVRISKLAELTGYTVNAIRKKTRSGYWVEGVHWRKAPDGRLFFNTRAIEQWVQGNAA